MKNLMDVDFKPLEEHVSGLIGKEIELKKEMRVRGLYLVSKNLKDDVGIFQSVLNDVQIGSFGPITQEEDGIWGHISFHYSMKSGGTNGIGLCGFSCKDGEWYFRNESL